MVKLVNILVFLIFKAGEIAAANYLLTYFNCRYDILLLAFYGFLSLFQALFFIIQNLAKHKDTRAGVLFLRYTPIIMVLMELVIILTSGYYLFLQENAIQNLLFVATVLTQIEAMFYLLIIGLFGKIIGRGNIYLKTASIIPMIILLTASLGVPTLYYLLKMFVFKKEIVFYDNYLALGVIANNFIITLALFWGKVIAAKRTAHRIRTVSIGLTKSDFIVDDGNEFGLIQSAMRDLGGKIDKEKDRISLINDYVSSNIREQIGRFGIQLGGEMKTVTASFILYEITDEDKSPEVRMNMYAKINQIIGEYADEYDAYPFFYHNRATLVFGSPFHYEHQKLNALESGVKIISDIEKYGTAEETRISVYVGIFTGKVIAGAVSTRGREKKEYTVFGEAVDNAERIAAVAKKLDKRMVCDEATVENLKSKFFVDKSYKVKVGSEELTLAQVRV